MSQEPLQELLTLKQASELLKVHPNTLRAWDKKGILRAIRIGERGLRRYRKEDLMKFTEHKKWKYKLTT